MQDYAKGNKPRHLGLVENYIRRSLCSGIERLGMEWSYAGLQVFPFWMRRRQQSQKNSAVRALNRIRTASSHLHYEYVLDRLRGALGPVLFGYSTSLLESVLSPLSLFWSACPACEVSS